MTLTSELKDAQLDLWAAKAAGIELEVANGGLLHVELCHGEYELYSPSTDWSQGGPIIAREKISLAYHEEDDSYIAYYFRYGQMHGEEGRDTDPLIAAMRCYVASKFGEEVPDE